jgi:predicted HTH domain antitoxin
MRPKIHIDLFSGIGGFSLAARNCGFTTAAFCEIDTYCQAVLKKNFPGVPIFDDVFALTKQKVDNAVSLLHDSLMGKPKDRKYDGAVELYKSGMSIGDCSEFYNITRQAMWKILKQRGASFRPKEKYGFDNGFYRGGKTADGRAHNIVEQAIKKGVLVRQPCEVCGINGKYEDGRSEVQAHHDDYNRPLQVRWLCKKHHYEWHEKNKAVKLGEGVDKRNPASGIDLLTAGFP